MASNKTPNLNMDIWAETDYFKRAELNGNFTKIDDKSKDHTDKIGVLSKNKVNPYSLGVIGNGVNDDTSFLQQALNNSNGKVLVLPKPDNYYRITNKLTVPSNITIVMEGNGMIKYEGTVATNVFYGTNVTSFEIVGGVIDGGNAGAILSHGPGTKSTMAGLYLTNSTRQGKVRINGTKFQNTHTVGASLVGFNIIDIPNYDVENAGEGNLSTAWAGESIVVKNCGNVTIGNFQAKKCTDGMGILVCDNVSIANMIFEDCAIGPSISACKNVSIGVCTVRRPVFRGFDCVSWENFDASLSYGADIISVDSLTVICEDITIGGTTYRGTGIAIDSTLSAKINATIKGAKKGFIMSRNYLSNTNLPRRNGTLDLNVVVENSLEEGIYVSAVDVVKVNGITLNNSQGAAGTYSGVKLLATGVDNKISVAVVDVTSVDTQTTKKQKHGIEVADSLQYIDRLVIKGTYRGATVSPLNINYAYEANLSLVSLDTDGGEIPMQWINGKRGVSIEPSTGRTRITTGDLYVAETSKGIYMKNAAGQVKRIRLNATGDGIEVTS